MSGRSKLSLLSKLGFLTTVAGFCMPVSCQMNGFQIASVATQSQSILVGIMLYLVFAGALLPLVFAVLAPAFGKNGIPISIDFLCLAGSIVGGLVAFSEAFQKLQLQEGAYVILSGWAFSLISLSIAALMKNSPPEKIPKT